MSETGVSRNSVETRSVRVFTHAAILAFTLRLLSQGGITVNPAFRGREAIISCTVDNNSAAARISHSIMTTDVISGGL